ncbi:MAG: JAB domain-containing protein, partial [bacterium]|nr:JAB domain-containing protein [bacterium]
KFITLFLHGEQIAGWTVTGIGVIDGVLVHPREVFRNAIITNSTGIVIAHNHPSGSLEISRDDVAITKRLIEAGEIIGIPLIDHFIITGSSYISFKAAGYIIDEDESENEEILLKELA